MLCELTGNAPANLRVQFRSQALNMGTSLLVSDDTFKQIHRHGGIDGFLLQQCKEKLTRKAWRLRREIANAVYGCFAHN